MNYYIGWDVGAWHCDRRGNPQDALCALKGDSLQGLDLVGTAWRGNLREALVAKDPVFAAALKKVGIELREGQSATWGIDTPLGWPNAFRDLIGSNGNTVDVPKKATRNLYLFRQTEFWLFDGRFRPLSTVQDRIGSQSTKGIRFLHRCRFNRQSVGIWKANGHTAIETYPAPVRTSKCLGSVFKRLKARLLRQPAARGDNAQKDVKDSLWCALVAATFALDRNRLHAPPQNIPPEEGWIWIPEDCKAIERT
jgi:hypothetical protein